MPKKKFSEKELREARDRARASIASVGKKGLLTPKQVKALQKKIKL